MDHRTPVYLAYCTAYVALIVVMSSVSRLDAPDIRLLSPVFVPILLLVGLGKSRA